MLRSILLLLSFNRDRRRRETLRSIRSSTSALRHVSASFNFSSIVNLYRIATQGQRGEREATTHKYPCKFENNRQTTFSVFLRCRIRGTYRTVKCKTYRRTRASRYVTSRRTKKVEGATELLRKIDFRARRAGEARTDCKGSRVRVDSLPFLRVALRREVSVLIHCLTQGFVVNGSGRRRSSPHIDSRATRRSRMGRSVDRHGRSFTSRHSRYARAIA